MQLSKHTIMTALDGIETHIDEAGPDIYDLLAAIELFEYCGEINDYFQERENIARKIADIASKCKDSLQYLLEKKRESS